MCLSVCLSVTRFVVAGDVSCKFSVFVGTVTCVVVVLDGDLAIDSVCLSVCHTLVMCQN